MSTTSTSSLPQCTSERNCSSARCSIGPRHITGCVVVEEEADRHQLQVVLHRRDDHLVDEHGLLADAEHVRNRMAVDVRVEHADLLAGLREARRRGSRSASTCRRRPCRCRRRAPASMRRATVPSSARCMPPRSFVVSASRSSAVITSNPSATRSTPGTSRSTSATCCSNESRSGQPAMVSAIVTRTSPPSISMSRTMSSSVTGLRSSGSMTPLERLHDQIAVRLAHESEPSRSNFLRRRGERTRILQHGRVEIAVLFDPLERLLHAEVARPDRRRQLLPAKRRRDRSAGLGANRVHGGDRLAVAVLPVVDEHALALLLQPLGRDLARVALLEQPRRLLGEVVGLLERRPSRDRRDDVDSVGAARLHVAGQLELVEKLANQVSDLDRELEAIVGRIEVEEDEVRPVRLVDARVPRVHVDAVVLHHEEHRFGRIRRAQSRRAAILPRVARCGTGASGSSSAGA